ncbi:MAG: 3-methyl-2-oxobutanoate hydroxymethyltransferase [Anaerolineaceae bacterium]|nr:3-methyl-2-oxobutanoate hydroxymethyltransferase [Anaerolineaceae bacterium]
MTARKKVTIKTLYKRMNDGQPITMITCYDYSMASFVEKAGVDMVLVGDSLGMTMLGYEGTLPVTMNDMIRHSQAVRRGTPNSFLVGDMPYMTYQASDESAVLNAGRFMAEAGCDAVKLEGGRTMATRIKAIADAGIPVMGHLGLTPQSVSALGGFRVQGKSAEQAKLIIEDSKILEEAGAFSILFEMVPDRVQKIITERAEIPVISLGSGPDADGQLLIFHDMFALFPDFKPRMAKVFANAGERIAEGLANYVTEVTDKSFPQVENHFTMKDEEYEDLLKLLGD